MPRKRRSTKVITFRVTYEQKEAVYKAADDLGLEPSEFIRNVVLPEANKIAILKGRPTTMEMRHAH